MIKPHTVTPQEALEIARSKSGRLPGGTGEPGELVGALAHTVATEPERTRAAVVKALREIAAEWHPSTYPFLRVVQQADAIENGADI